MNSLQAFSHEYVHYLDHSIYGRPKWIPYLEMTASYYSKEFKHSSLLNENRLYDLRHYLYSEFTSSEIALKPMIVVEDYLGREIEIKDFYSLYSDVMISLSLDAGINIPELFTKGMSIYPSYHYISIQNYITRNYGKEAVYAIIFDEQLKDGTKKDMDDVIQEWSNYLENMTEEDYDQYY